MKIYSCCVACCSLLRN